MIAALVHARGRPACGEEQGGGDKDCAAFLLDGMLVGRIGKLWIFSEIGFVLLF